MRGGYVVQGPPTLGSAAVTQIAVSQQSQTAALAPPAPAGMAVQYPPAPAPGSALYVSHSLPPLQYKAEYGGNPEFAPLLPDLSGGWIDLEGTYPMDQPFKPTQLVERVPGIPFWPGTTSNPSYGYGQMGAAADFVANFELKEINPYMIQYASGWVRIPNPAPVYVAHPHFGVGVVFYWMESRLSVMANLPAVRMYAVLKLAPLPVAPASERYVGRFWKVPATWCKPMKVCISQFPTQAASDPFNVVFVIDTGGEWKIPLDVVRIIYRDPAVRHIRAAVNAFLRDYPWLLNVFTFTPELPPPTVVNAIASYSRVVASYQSALSGQGTAVVSSVQGVVPGNFPGATTVVRLPPPQPSATAAAKTEEAEPTTEETTPATKSAEAILNLSSCSSIQLRNWE